LDLRRSRTLVRTRESNSGLATEQGRFRSLYDFCERIEPKFLNKRVFESVIKSGAMIRLGHESQCWRAWRGRRGLQRVARSRDRDSTGFSVAGLRRRQRHSNCGMRRMEREERLASEYAMLGFYVFGASAGEVRVSA